MKKVCKYCGKEYNWEKGQLNWTKYGSGCCNSNIRSEYFCCYECGQKDRVKKVKETKLKKYGDSNYNNMQKNRETCLKKYGVECSLQSNNNKEKAKQTFLKKYGVMHCSQIKVVKEKIRQSKKERYGSETYNNTAKAKQTCLIRYGVENPAQVKSIQEKIKATNNKKFGYDNAMQNASIRKKSDDTKKKLKTYSKSKEEDVVFNLLCKKFNIVLRQYKSEKYPFNCDFYIPEKDLYIEYQGMWTHGKKGRKILGPYDNNNPLHKTILELWLNKAKTFPQFASAIKIWTSIDPLKRKFAKENNLNWLEFFTIKDVEEWLK